MCKCADSYTCVSCIHDVLRILYENWIPNLGFIQSQNKLLIERGGWKTEPFMIHC
jgi:hypothetical protein